MEHDKNMHAILSPVLAIALLLLPSHPAPGGDAASVAGPSQRQAPVAGEASAKVLRVGPGKDFLLPSTAAEFARDGDVVEIDSTTFNADAAIWRANNLTIRAVGKRAHILANGAHAEGKGLWVVKGNNTTIENIEFSGAKVAHRNGAAIRLEGAGLTVRGCYFHDNENGLLTGVNPASDVVIENSEFAHNGFGDGQSHNMYIGAVRSFTLRHSYVHHANVGHNVKSRATKSFVLYNRIMDEQDGNSSYVIDLPNGGLSYIIGNLIQHGPRAENSTLISFGAEGLGRQVNKLYLVNNTLVNDRPQGGRFLFVAAGTVTAMSINNIFAGEGIASDGPVTARGNLALKRSELVESAPFDYRVRPDSRAVGAGEEPGEGDGFSLQPLFEYEHPLGARPRVAKASPDIGAHGVGKDN